MYISEKNIITSPPPHFISFSQRHFPKFPKNLFHLHGYFISGLCGGKGFPRLDCASWKKKGVRGRPGATFKILSAFFFILSISLALSLSTRRREKERKKESNTCLCCKTFTTAIFLSSYLTYNDLYFSLYINGYQGVFSLLLV